MKIVDPANPIPKYLQISAWLKDLIQSGRFKTGEKLPSEIELSKMCGVNRNTLRQAISKLVAEGMLYKRRGSGTFVSSTDDVALTHRLTRISSFRDDLAELGILEKTKLLKKGLETASDDVARALVLPKGSQVVVIRRLRIGNQTPLIVEESYLPPTMFGRILKMNLTGSLYKLLSEKFGIVLARSEQNIRAVNLSREVSRQLKIKEGSAGLFMQSLTFDDGNVPVEMLYSYYRGDKYVFEIEVGTYHLQDEAL